MLYPVLFRYVSRTTGACQADVEDIVGETLLHAWRDRLDFRGDASSPTWVISIARNRVGEYRRREGLRRNSHLVMQAIERIEAEPAAEHLLQESEMKRKVRQALEDISAAYSQVLIQVYLEDRTVRDVAAMLGESEEATGSRLRRAREAFKDSLQRRTTDETP
jgi:RNA polymerase sigma-70 factor (ECF subfamily)